MLANGFGLCCSAAGCCWTCVNPICCWIITGCCGVEVVIDWLNGLACDVVLVVEVRPGVVLLSQNSCSVFGDICGGVVGRRGGNGSSVRAWYVDDPADFLVR